MNEQWQELKDTIIEMRDNDGTGTQQEVCRFLANLMDVLEKQMSSSEKPKDSINAVLTDIKAEIKALTDGDVPEHIWNVDALKIIDNHRISDIEKESL